MICPKCGRNIPEGSVCPCSAAPLSSNPAVNLLKTLGSSPLFLAAAVLFSVAVLLNIAAVAGVRSDLSSMMYYAAGLDLDPSVLYGLADTMSGVTMGSVVVGSIPAILNAVALWMFFATCRNRENGNVSTAGLTISKVLAIISAVCVCLMMVLALIFCGVLILGGAMGELDDVGYEYGMYLGEALVLVGVIALVVMAVALVLVLLYYISVVKTINRIKATALTGAPDNRVSQYLIVMNYILAVFAGLGALTSIGTSILSCLGGLCQAAVLVLISLLLSRYRAGMTMLMYPPVQPVYGNPQPPQQGPWA